MPILLSATWSGKFNDPFQRPPNPCSANMFITCLPSLSINGMCLGQNKSNSEIHSSHHYFLSQAHNTSIECSMQVCCRQQQSTSCSSATNPFKVIMSHLLLIWISKIRKITLLFYYSFLIWHLFLVKFTKLWCVLGPLAFLLRFSKSLPEGHYNYSSWTSGIQVAPSETTDCRTAGATKGQ